MIRDGNEHIAGNVAEEVQDDWGDESIEKDDDIYNHDLDEDGYETDDISLIESPLWWFREKIALPENELKALETKLDQRPGYLHELIDRYPKGSLTQEEKEELEKITLSSSYHCQRLLVQFEMAISRTPKNDISNIYKEYNDRFTNAYLHIFKALTKINISKYKDKSWRELVKIITGTIKNIIRNDQEDQYFRRNNEFIEEDIILEHVVDTLKDSKSILGKYFETIEDEEIKNIGHSDRKTKRTIKFLKKFKEYLQLDFSSLRERLKDFVEYRKIKRQCCECLNYILICDVNFYSKLQQRSDWSSLEKDLKKNTEKKIKRCDEILGFYGDLHQNEKSNIRKRNISLVFDLNPGAFQRYNPLNKIFGPVILDQKQNIVAKTSLISFKKLLQEFCKERSLLWYLQYCRNSNPKSPKWTALALVQRASLQDWLVTKFDGDNLDHHFMRDVDEKLVGSDERLRPIIDGHISEDSNLFNNVFKQILYDYGTRQLPNRERGIDLFIDMTTKKDQTNDENDQMENLKSKQKGDFRKYIQKHLDWLVSNYPDLGRFRDVLSSETRKVYSAYMNEMALALRTDKIHFSATERKHLGLSDKTKTEERTKSSA